MIIDVNGLITTLGAVFTLIGAVLAVLPLLLNRTGEVTAPLDPSIKVIGIERVEIDQKLWKKRKIRIYLSYYYLINSIIVGVIYPIYQYI